MLQIPKDHGIQLQVGEQLARSMAAANVLGRLNVVNAIGKRTGKRLPLSTSTRPTLKFAEVDQDEPKHEDAYLGFDLMLPADDAAAYIRGLTPVTRDVFDGLTAQYRKLAFTLAGTADDRLAMRTPGARRCSSTQAVLSPASATSELRATKASSTPCSTSTLSSRSPRETTRHF